MPKLLHTADWQIGKQYGQFEADEAALLAEARFLTVERIAALARERAVDMVLVAGDVFDAQGVADKTIMACSTPGWFAQRLLPPQIPPLGRIIGPSDLSLTVGPSVTEMRGLSGQIMPSSRCDDYRADVPCRPRHDPIG